MNRLSPRGMMDNRGFSLIELMVVIVILGILASQIAPRILDRIGTSKISKAKMDIAHLTTALKMYKVDNGVYPTTEQGLSALIEAPETGTLPRNYNKDGYLESKRVPQDPWQRDFIFISPGANGDFDIISYGADGEQGGEGENQDINSWEIQ